jgi:hypothetical protein
VYLAKELPTAERPFAEADAPVAVKKVHQHIRIAVMTPLEHVPASFELL